jgi:hypothetical protein
MEAREELRQLEEKVAQGLKKAYVKMVEFKKQKNSPKVISRNGQVIRVPADKILPTTKAMNPYPSNPSHSQSTDQS